MIPFLIFFVVSFVGTLYVMPHSIRKLKENGYVVLDMYKFEKVSIPTNVGTILVFTSLLSISLVPLIIRIFNLFFDDYKLDNYYLTESLLALILVVSIFALYGLVDDLVDIGRKLKLIIPLTFVFPLISVVELDFFHIPFYGKLDLTRDLYGDISREELFQVIVIPIYVMVVANLVNMHSGYNGLQSGLSIILLIAIIVKSYIDSTINQINPIGAFLGSLLAFYYFNKYPSKVFEGNIGALFYGSIIGGTLVVQGLWWFGIFILIPHIFNFLLWMFWLIMMKVNPEKYLGIDGQHQKFGKVSKDGFIIPPNYLTLKWIPNYFWKIDEKKSVLILQCLTTIFCLFAIVLDI